MIDGRNGEVSYYEYGRYDDAGFGEVRHEGGLVEVGGNAKQRLTVEFGEDNNPTPQSFQTLLKNLTQTNGPAYAFWATYTKLTNGAYDIMKRFAELRMREVNVLKSAAKYDINSNHCFTFALEVAAQAGVNADVSTAPDLQVVLVTITGGTLEAPADLAVELPSRQMLELQRRYRPLNVSQSGNIDGGFTFPEALYAP